MSQTDLSSVHYVGGDVDEQNLSAARNRIEPYTTLFPRSIKFMQFNLLDDDLPDSDALLCRDFLQHISNFEVDEVIQNFMHSNITWLLATSHGNLENEDLVTSGEFRPLNLTIAPVSLPNPTIFIEDPLGSSHILGVWHRSCL